MRDFRGHLVCTVPGCGAVIKAATGYEELVKLIRHMRCAHGVAWTLNEALENRVLMERDERGQK